MDEYHRLISRETIKQCFDRINQMGFCNIDFDEVWNKGKVCKIDVSKDVAVEDCHELSGYLQIHLSNNRKYQSRIISGNLIIEKNVTTKGLKTDHLRQVERTTKTSFLTSTMRKPLSSISAERHDLNGT